MAAAIMPSCANRARPRRVHRHAAMVIERFATIVDHALDEFL
jgi:hypothetical protein